MGWDFKVGKRYQITIRALAPVLEIMPGDYVTVQLENGKLIVKKKDAT